MLFPFCILVMTLDFKILRMLTVSHVNTYGYFMALSGVNSNIFYFHIQLFTIIYLLD